MAAPVDPGIATAIQRQRAVRTRTPRNPLAPILTNPAVALAGINQNRTNQQANAALQQQRSQALINFGAPSLVNGLGFTVDPNTAAAAAANQFSTVASLGHQRDLAHQTLLNGLAGRGLLHSGELGYQSGEQNRAYGQALYGAQSQLLAQLNDYLNSYLGATGGANQQYQQALLDALGGYGRNPLGVV